MNRKELESKRLDNYYKLDIYAFRPKYNAVEVDINNSLEHEMSKFICVWLIRNGVPADLLGECGLKPIETSTKEFGRKFKYEWERPVVITEARFKKSEQKDFCYNLKTPMKKQTRRVDIFILDTGEKVEIETNHKIKKEDSITVYV